MCYYINMYFLLVILVIFLNMNIFMKLLFLVDCIKRCLNYWYLIFYYLKFNKSIDIFIVKIKDLKNGFIKFLYYLFIVFRFGNVYIIDVNKEMVVLFYMIIFFVFIRMWFVNNYYI